MERLRVKFPYKRRGVHYKIAAAFVLLIILPFIAWLLYLTAAYENQVRERWKKDSYARIETIQADMKNLHISLNAMLGQIRLDTALSPNTIHRNGYNLRTAKLQLQRYAAANNVLYVLAYVDTAQNRLLSNISSDNLSHFITRTFDMDASEEAVFWDTISAGNHTHLTEPLLVAPSGTVRGNILVYAVNLMGTGLFETPKMLVLLDANMIEARMTGVLPAEGAGMLVTNSDGIVILSVGMMPTPFTYAHPAVFDYTEAVRVARAYDYVLTYSIAENGWNYYMFIPVNTLLYEVRGATQIYNMFSLSFAVVSLLFIALCYKYSHVIQKQLDASYPIRCKYFLNQLLTGEVNKAEGLAEARDLYMPLDNMYYTVTLLYTAEGESTLLVRELEASLQKSLAGTIPGYCIEGKSDNAVTLLLALPHSEQEAHHLEMVRLQALINKRHHIFTMACMGGVYAGIENIHLSFQEAIRTARYRHTSDKNICIVFSDTGDDSAFTHTYPTALLSAFYEAITGGNPEIIIQKIQDVIHATKALPITLCRCIYCDLAFGILRYLEALDALSSRKELLDDISRALETSEMREIQRLLNNLLHRFVVVGDDVVSHNLLNRARQYIDKHYHQSSLSIAELADSMGMSAGHLSRSYKKESGETLLHYISNKRIEQAKLLLVDSNLPLHEIVQEIGYIGESSFHKKFKSTVGLTPGEYRDKHK